MRIERIEKENPSGERLRMTLDDGSVLRITQQELLRFRLTAGQELTEEELALLHRCAKRSETRTAAAHIAGRRALSRQELQQKLCRRGSSEEDASQAADWLEEIGALDDEAYAALLVRHYSDRGYGPGRIRQELLRRGISRDLWEQALKQAPPAQGLICAYIEKKLQDPEDPKQIKRVSDGLLRRGFSWEQIRPALRVYTQGLDGETEHV